LNNKSELVSLLTLPKSSTVAALQPTRRPQLTNTGNDHISLARQQSPLLDTVNVMFCCFSLELRVDI